MAKNNPNLYNASNTDSLKEATNEIETHILKFCKAISISQKQENISLKIQLREPDYYESTYENALDELKENGVIKEFKIITDYPETDSRPIETDSLEEWEKTKEMVRRYEDTAFVYVVIHFNPQDALNALSVDDESISFEKGDIRSSKNKVYSLENGKIRYLVFEYLFDKARNEMKGRSFQPTDEIIRFVIQSTRDESVAISFDSDGLEAAASGLRKIGRSIGIKKDLVEGKKGSGYRIHPDIACN